MSIEILHVDPPFSFFEFAERFHNPIPLKRILSLMRKNGCRTIIVCEKELTEVTEKDREKILELGRKLKLRQLYELSFFKAIIPSPEEISQYAEDFLGFAIVCIDDLIDGGKRPYVLESIIVKPQGQDEYLSCWSNHSTYITDTKFSIKGSFFTQQHGILNVCAHAAIKTALENLNNFDVKVKVPSMNDINAVLNKKDIKKKKIAGLTIKEMVEVITKLGFHCIPFDCSPSRSFRKSYQQMAYYAIESGFPVIISFWVKKKGHVVTAIGHTFSDDTWLPKAEKGYFQATKEAGYLTSSSWMDNIIMHDDNYGPYYCMPTQYLERKKPRIIIVSPFKLELYGNIAETHAAQALYTWIIPKCKSYATPCRWMDYFMKYFKSNELILRTMFIKKDNYINYLKNLKENLSTIIEYSIQLPDHFWVVEISLPELFSINRKKVGEIIIKNVDITKEAEPIATVRLPGLFINLRKDNGRLLLEIVNDAPEEPMPLIKMPYTIS